MKTICKSVKLPEILLEHYKSNKSKIKERLDDFENIPQSQYFYEFCYCLMTPQSKAENAQKVQNILESIDFKNSNIKPVDILFEKSHYIRFHNQKAKRLMWARENFNLIENILNSENDNFTKRNQLAESVNGIGLKEAGHFLRNIGYKNLAILDRHILATLKMCGLFEEMPNISNKKIYWQTEQLFLEFASKINIPIDELDLLFFSYQNGNILK